MICIFWQRTETSTAIRLQSKNWQKSVRFLLLRVRRHLRETSCWTINGSSLPIPGFLTMISIHARSVWTLVWTSEMVKWFVIIMVTSGYIIIRDVSLIFWPRMEQEKNFSWYLKINWDTLIMNVIILSMIPGESFGFLLMVTDCLPMTRQRIS